MGVPPIAADVVRAVDVHEQRDQRDDEQHHHGGAVEEHAGRELDVAALEPRPALLDGLDLELVPLSGGFVGRLRGYLGLVLGLGLGRDGIERAGVTLSSVPKLAISMEQLTTSKISPQEGFMLTRINGSYDIQSIVKITPMPQLDALLVFWKLQTGGHITFAAPKGK